MNVTKTGQQLAVFFAILVLVLSLFSGKPGEVSAVLAFVTWIILSMLAYISAILLKRISLTVVEREYTERLESERKARERQEQEANANAGQRESA